MTNEKYVFSSYVLHLLNNNNLITISDLVTYVQSFSARSNRLQHDTLKPYNYELTVTYLHLSIRDFVLQIHWRQMRAFCLNCTAEPSIGQILLSQYITQNIFLHNRNSVIIHRYW